MCEIKKAVQQTIIDYSHDCGHIAGVKSVSKGKLKAKMLEYLREVEASGEPLVVTDRGREVLVIRPIESATYASSGGMILQESAYAMPVSGMRQSEDELLEELRLMATPTSPIDEQELMAPLPLGDWDAEKEGDKQLWS